MSLKDTVKDFIITRFPALVDRKRRSKDVQDCFMEVIDNMVAIDDVAIIRDAMAAQITSLTGQIQTLESNASVSATTIQSLNNSVTLINTNLTTLSIKINQKPFVLKANVLVSNAMLLWHEGIVSNGNLVLSLVDVNNNAIYNNIYTVIPSSSLGNTVADVVYGNPVVSADRKTVTIPIKKPNILTILTNIQVRGPDALANGAKVGALILGD